MDTTANLNAAMRYIEKHMFDALDFSEIERIACCSEYQFRRMFSYLAGMSLGEYIRKRKLSLAADLLFSGNEKIIEISLKCGYESPDAFSKAFQSMYGILPSAYRKNANTSKAFPPLFFHLTLKGGIEMDYRIVEREEFYVMGKIGRIPLIYYGANQHTADVWKKLKQEDLLVLMEYSEIEPKGIITLHKENVTNEKLAAPEGEEILYGVGVVMEKQMPDRFKTRFDTLPCAASTWLVFSAMDNQLNEKESNLLPTQQVYARIGEWLPTSEYEETEAPIITWYESHDFSKPNKKSEIWVSVRKR
jgi:AraC family transcriptional regulator